MLHLYDAHFLLMKSKNILLSATFSVISLRQAFKKAYQKFEVCKCQIIFFFRRNQYFLFNKYAFNFSSGGGGKDFIILLTKDFYFR